MRFGSVDPREASFRGLAFFFALSIGDARAYGTGVYECVAPVPTEPMAETDVDKWSALDCSIAAYAFPPTVSPVGPDLATLRRRRRESRTGKGCIAMLHELACRDSPWKDLDVRGRYEASRELLARVVPQFRLRTKKPEVLEYVRSALVCMAARETLFLDPVSITCSNMSESVTQSGLGHINDSSFDDLFQVASDPAGVLSKVKRAQWLAPYNQCASGTARTPSPREIFGAAYQRDPGLQYRAMVRVLSQKSIDCPMPGKKGTSEEERTIEEKRSLFACAIERYNASDTRGAYAKAVLKCADCLRPISGGKTIDPQVCLVRAGLEPVKDGVVCPRSARSASDRRPPGPGGPNR